MLKGTMENEGTFLIHLDLEALLQNLFGISKDFQFQEFVTPTFNCEFRYTHKILLFNLSFYKTKANTSYS